MGEMEEYMSWRDREDRYEGTLKSELEYHHHNHYFESANQSLDDQESSSNSNSKREKDADTDSCDQPSPLGLTLTKTPSFLSLVQMSLCKEKHTDFHETTDNLSSVYEYVPRTKKHHSISQSLSDKLKASNFPSTFIKIGAWQRTTRHEGDLTAKLYYAKHKLVWEVLDGALKSKIEIQWSDIIAIKAITHDINETGTLEIELNQPPLFYREINPQPRKHTLWQQAYDFTGGQASIWRRHYVRFPHGVLDKHYEKLLQCDQRLFNLSHKPFPSHESPYFNPTMFGISELSLDFNGYGSAYPTTPRTIPTRLSTNSSTSSVKEMPFICEGESNNQFVTWAQTAWGSTVMNNINEGSFNNTSETQDNQFLNSQNDQMMQHATYVNHMLDGHVYSDEFMPPQQYDDDSLQIFLYSDDATNRYFF